MRTNAPASLLDSQCQEGNAERTQRGVNSLSFLICLGGPFSLLASSLPTVDREVNTINTRPKSQLTLDNSCSPALGSGERGRRWCPGSRGREAGRSSWVLRFLSRIAFGRCVTLRGRGKNSIRSLHGNWMRCELSRGWEEGLLHWPPTGLLRGPHVPPLLMGCRPGSPRVPHSVEVRTQRSLR